MSEAGFYTVLHKDPLVAYIKDPWRAGVVPHMRKDRAAFLLGRTWTRPGISDSRLERWFGQYRREYPEHYLEVLCDVEEDLHFFNRIGVPATFVNAMALADERVFYPGDKTREFDAVCLSRPSPEKKIQLAAKIPRLLWLTYNRQENAELFDSVVSQRNVTCPQYASGSSIWWNPERIATAMNQAVCGLCLTELPGPTFSVAEYLLCGLPIVKSAASRCPDEFFEDTYVTTCPPTAEAVREAVAAWQDRLVSPDTIRSVVLNKMLPHRKRFVAACRRAYWELGLSRDAAVDLHSARLHKFTEWQPLGLLWSGGSDYNIQRLRVSQEEYPRMRRLWVPEVEGRFWEHSTPYETG